MALRQAQHVSILIPSDAGHPSGGFLYEGHQCRSYQAEYGHHIALGSKRKRRALSSSAEEEAKKALVRENGFCEVQVPLRESVSGSAEAVLQEEGFGGEVQGAVIPRQESAYSPYSGQQHVVRPSGMFGVLFPNRSFPMDASKFMQVDSLHWVLDMNAFVGEGYEDVKEMCIFLLNEFSLPPDKALAVYVQSPGSQFEYRGAVTASCPSAVLQLLWPKRGGDGLMQLTGADCPPLTAQIGVSVEDAATLPVCNVGRQSRIEEMALKVGENLFNFMQSFCSVQSSKLVVPLDILDQWFKKFQDRARRDPEYLNRFRV